MIIYMMKADTSVELAIVGMFMEIIAKMYD